LQESPFWVDPVFTNMIAQNNKRLPHRGGSLALVKWTGYARRTKTNLPDEIVGLLYLISRALITASNWVKFGVKVFGA
jgi:hypothetical protein